MRETGLTNNDWQTSTRQNTTKTQGSNVRHAQWSNFLPAAHQGKRKKQPLNRFHVLCHRTIKIFNGVIIYAFVFNRS